jgi:hypothetical protein
MKSCNGRGGHMWNTVKSDMMWETISGYIRVSMICDEDYEDIMLLLDDIKNDLNLKDDDDVEKWIYQKVDLAILKYYTNYKKSADHTLKEKINFKIRHLCQRQGLRLDVEGEYAFENLNKWFHVISESGYPHQVLAFCFRHLIEEWSIEKIIQHYSERDLDQMYVEFVNEYSENAGIPVYVVNLYLVNLKKKLASQIKEVISRNDGFTMGKLFSLLEMSVGETFLKDYFGKNQKHDISDWCNKVRRKVLKNMVSLFEKAAM